MIPESISFDFEPTTSKIRYNGSRCFARNLGAFLSCFTGQNKSHPEIQIEKYPGINR